MQHPLLLVHALSRPCCHLLPPQPAVEHPHHEQQQQLMSLPHLLLLPARLCEGRAEEPCLGAAGALLLTPQLLLLPWLLLQPHCW